MQSLTIILKTKNKLTSFVNNLFYTQEDTRTIKKLTHTTECSDYTAIDIAADQLPETPISSDEYQPPVLELSGLYANNIL